MSEEFHRFNDGAGEERLAVVQELLRLRRAGPDDLRQKIEESVRTSYNDLIRSYEENRSFLVDFRPEIEDDLLQFRDQGGRLLPHALLRQLEQHRVIQEQLLKDKESQLYEDFILKQAGSAIRERIDRAEAWREQVNGLLENRSLSNGEILSISWRPVMPEPGTPGRPARIVELLRHDVETLTELEILELTDHFRARVAEVRDQDRKNTLEKSFADALKDALDYREWFAFSLHSKIPGMERVELTDVRYGTRSGAEKALAVFIPLLAAAYARFTGAWEDAPKLLGLDEAFAGVDSQNTREMFRFLVDLGFSWIMTSEKLWGVADTLPGCVTYELIRRGPAVTAIFYLWDGTSKCSAIEPLLGEDFYSAMRNAVT
jgi:uncharacterized protein YPO0396